MTASPNAHSCPLCRADTTREFHRDRARHYRECIRCQLIFVPRAEHLSPAAEKAEYDRHENDPADAGYRRFLGRLARPLGAQLAPSRRGLDFGCGPGPALAQMLEEQGHRVVRFDRYYAPDRGVWRRRYDFITATEVLEHLRVPARALPRLWSRLRPGGLLGVMTKLARDREAFARWHYIRDPTHVCFYRRATFAWLAQRWGADLRFEGADVILLRKPARPAAPPAITCDSLPPPPTEKPR